MIHRFFFAVVIQIVLSHGCNSQVTDLDDIFKDNSKKNGLFLGADIARIATGTINGKLSNMLAKERFILSAELGAPIFGYRFKTDLVMLERPIKHGFEFNLSGLTRIGENIDWGSVSMFIGLEYEQWEYLSGDRRVAELNGIKESGMGSNSEYLYTLDSDYIFLFNHRVNRIGGVYSIACEAHTKNYFDINFHVGFESNGSKYNSDKSSGVNWVSSEPKNYVRGFFGRSGAYVRISLTYKFRIT